MKIEILGIDDLGNREYCLFLDNDPNDQGPGIYELIPEGKFTEVVVANAAAYAGLKAAARMIKEKRGNCFTKNDFDLLQSIIDLALRDLVGEK